MKKGIIKDFTLSNDYITDSIALYNSLVDYLNKYPSENVITFDTEGYSHLEGLKKKLRLIIYGDKKE